VIAQVWRPSGSAQLTAEQREQGQRAAQDAVVKTRAADGCEGIYILGARGGEASLALVLWRDEAAMKGAASQQAGEIAAAQQQNASMHVGEPEIYEVLASA
jgi:quinol monooxygenase YgiN